MRTGIQPWLAARINSVAERAIDVSIVAYAIWTITCHAVMLIGGNTYTLAGATYVATALSVAGTAGLLWWRRKHPLAAASDAAAATASDLESDSKLELRERLVLGGLVVVQLGLWLWLRDPMTQWIAMSLYLALAWVLSVRTPLRLSLEPPTVARWQELALWLLALGCAIVSMATHRWRNDDCYYVNLAVTLVDLPKAPLLSTHTIHALGSSSVFPPYRIHTFEPLAGLISHITGIEAIRVLHIGMAGVFAALIPLALARLFRLLDPARWFYMVLAVLCLFLVDGSGDRGFANQAFVRVFTGKSVMLSIAVPLLVRHALALGLRPRLATFGLLLATQIAAVGMSSTGLWLVPTLVMLCVGATLRKDLAWLRALGLGFLSCSYVLGLALWVRSQVMYGGTKGDMSRALAVTSSGGSGARFDLLRRSFEQNIGEGRIVPIFLCLLLLAIPLAHRPIARRYLATVSLALAVLLMNPFFANFLRYNVYGKYTGQRAFWVAPLPAAFAIACVALIPVYGPKLRQALGMLASAALLALFCFVVPTTYALGKDNNVAFKWPPEPKVPKYAFALSKVMSEHLRQDDIVLAPELVSWYLPTVHHHPKPLLANEKYMVASKSEKYRLEQLVELVSATKNKISEQEAAKFSAQITEYGVDAVVLKTPARGKAPLAATLTALKFARVPGASGYQLWVSAERARSWPRNAPPPGS